MSIQTKNKPINLEDRQAKINRLLSFNRIALEAMTMSELRELGAFLVPKGRSLKKAQYINALLEISEPIRAQKLLESVTSLKLAHEVNITPELIESMYTKGLDASDAGEMIKSVLESRGYAASTIAKTKMKHLRNAIDSFKLNNQEGTNWSHDLYQYVKNYVSKYHFETNQEYSQTVEDYGADEESLVKFEGLVIVSWAKAQIDWACEQRDLLKGWHATSLALAITSGRRMDEIHGTCEYEVVDADTLRATGLSKKASDDSVLESPCLIDAYKWVEALNKLPENRRHQDNATVNNVIRVAIRDSVEGVLKTKLGFKMYKDSRDFYVCYLLATKYERTKHGSEINFAKKLIGHESKKNTLSYQKYVVVNP